MAAYPLNDLLRVRVLREDRAMEAVLSAQRKLEEAIRYLEAQREALASFHSFRLNEEVRLYGTIMGKKVSRNFVEEVLAGVTSLRHQELAHEERVREAEAGVVAAQTTLANAKIAYQEAIKSRQKIEEHRVIWTEEFLKEQEFYLEKELEDFRRRENDNEDVSTDDDALSA